MEQSTDDAAAEPMGEDAKVALAADKEPVPESYFVGASEALPYDEAIRNPLLSSRQRKSLRG